MASQDERKRQNSYGTRQSCLSVDLVTSKASLLSKTHSKRESV